jgi:hypothetical protein
MRMPWKLRSAAWFCVAAAGTCGVAHGQRQITLGPTDSFGAAGQPLVKIEVYEDAAGTQSLGPDDANYLILDTGANGILLDKNAYFDLAGAGYETVAVYDEVGVSGTSPLDVSEAYRLDYSGSSGPPLTIHDARIMSSSELDFGSIAGFYGLIGMPGMRDRVVRMDMDGEWFSSGGEMSLGALSPPTTFPAELPPSEGHRYNIPLRMQHFEQSGQRNPEDPLPTWAPLPFVPVSAQNGDVRYEGEMLLDTGAQLSVLSTQMAIDLGLDENGNGTLFDEAIDFQTVGGVGGTIQMPLIPLERLSVKSEEGVEIGWTDLLVGVLDIDESIGGVFGMDFLTAGWADAFLYEVICEILPEACPPERPVGQLNGVHFDFRNMVNDRGTMVFDLNPTLDVVTGGIAGDTDGDDDVDLNDLNNVRNNFGAAGAGVAGDAYPFNGIVDLEDLNAVRNNFGAGSSSSVPEPATWALGLASVVVAALALRRRRQ